MRKLLQIPSYTKKFLSIDEEAIYTVWKNRDNEYIVVINNAHDEVIVLETNINIAQLKEKYGIEL